MGDKMNRLLIQEKTVELTEAIKETEEYKKYKILSSKIDSDNSIQSLIKMFNEANKKYNDIQKYGKYYPDYDKIKKEFIEAKTKLYSNDVIKQFKKLEKQIQEYLSKISRDIGESVSEYITVPNELNLINKSCSTRR